MPNEIAEPIIKAVEEKIGGGITACEPLHGGMTNRSYIVTIKGEKFVLRLNGKSSAAIINRKLETLIYSLLQPLDVSDELIMIDSDLGFKLSRYIPDGREPDIDNPKELSECMRILRLLHGFDYRQRLYELGESELGLSYDIFKEIERYEALSNLAVKENYRQYDALRQKAFVLRTTLAKLTPKHCLCHIDAIPANFVVSKDRMYLLDFEYMRLSDPMIDLAMMAVFIAADIDKVELLLKSYYGDINKVDDNVRFRVYCYIALGGILWANWCELYAMQGTYFGEYQQSQLTMAEIFCKLAREVMG